MQRRRTALSRTSISAALARFANLQANASPSTPVLIYGPTASGKSALALDIAERFGGAVVNADASQVYACWRVVTARPDAAECARAPHRLFGHIAFDAAYSAGHWLREVAPLLATAPRPIIVGGTGLYFTALTSGLAEIPPIPETIRREADRLAHTDLIADLDPATRASTDLDNRARVQRAWEVQRTTGRGLAAWQADTPLPLLPPDQAICLRIDAPKDWLTPRIEARFANMLEGGALEEVAAMQDRYDPALPAFRAIGVPEIRAYLQGGLTRDEAQDRAVIATRQYAKRQRTWARRHFAAWHAVLWQ